MKFVEIKVTTPDGKTVMIAGDSPSEFGKSLQKSGLNQETRQKVIEHLLTGLREPGALQNGVHEELAVA